MSRYATTEYNRLQRVSNRLRDIYARAIAFRFTHDKLSEEIAALWQLSDYRKLVAYDRGYVQGMNTQLRADIWQNHIVWRLSPASGPTRTVHSEWTEEMSVLCRQPGQLYGGHYWTDDSGEPTDKVFTEYKPTN